MVIVGTANAVNLTDGLDGLAILPTVLNISGDGAAYDIGFGALSRLLVTATPLKVVVLDTGAYSNTGGQASTASFTAQDSDLTRFGVAHRGKYEDRKELGLIAAFHPKVLVVQTNSALQGHFMKNLMEFLNYNESPALFDTYTACMPEHGIADDASNRHARLAVESRMSPVFVHDPRKGDTLAERFSLEGNPDIGKDWTTGALEYVDENGNNRTGFADPGYDALIDRAATRRMMHPNRAARLKSQLDRLEQPLFIDIGCCDDDTCLCVALSDLFGELQSVDLRHLHIHQYNVWLFLLHFGNRFRT